MNVTFGGQVYTVKYEIELFALVAILSRKAA
jgi:hypothetical protein